MLPTVNDYAQPTRWVLIKPGPLEVILPPTCIPAPGTLFPGINAAANGVVGSDLIYYTGDRRRAADFIRLIGGQFSTSSGWSAYQALATLDADLLLATRVELRMPGGTLGWNLKVGYSHVREESPSSGAAKMLGFEVKLAVTTRVPS